MPHFCPLPLLILPSDCLMGFHRWGHQRQSRLLMSLSLWVLRLSDCRRFSFTKLCACVAVASTELVVSGSDTTEKRQVGKGTTNNSRDLSCSLCLLRSCRNDRWPESQPPYLSICIQVMSLFTRIKTPTQRSSVSCGNPGWARKTQGN